jgi:hypothetical protein
MQVPSLGLYESLITPPPPFSYYRRNNYNAYCLAFLAVLLLHGAQYCPHSRRNKQMLINTVPSNQQLCCSFLAIKIVPVRACVLYSRTIWKIIS